MLQLQCPVCGESRFDVNSRELSTGHALWYGESGRHGQKTRVFGRACLNCGHVVVFVDVEKLRRRFSQIQPQTGLKDLEA